MTTKSPSSVPAATWARPTGGSGSLPTHRTLPVEIPACRIFSAPLILFQSPVGLEVQPLRVSLELISLYKCAWLGVDSNPWCRGV